MRIAVAAAVLVALTSIAAAQAPGQTMSFDPENPPGAVEVRTVHVNYRSDIILADGVWVSTLLISAATENEELAGWSVAGYFLAAPIVHVAHGRGKQAVQSLALRAGLPLVGGMMGYRLGPNDTACIEGARSDDTWVGDGGCGDHGSISGMAFGLLAGSVTAMVLDAKYLTKYDKTVVGPTWTASIKPTRGGASFGVSGTF